MLSYTQRNPCEEIEQNKQKNNQCHSGAQTPDCLNTCQVPGSLMQQELTDDYSGYGKYHTVSRRNLTCEYECAKAYKVITNENLRGKLLWKLYLFNNSLCFSVEILDVVANQLGTRYINTRFNTDKGTWPPQQSKHFTTLAFIYHKNKRTQEQVITMAQTNIDKIMTTTDKQKCGDSSYCLEGSRTTKSIFELLTPLDHVDSSNQRIILIEGAPGIGKSFLLKHIAYLWAQKEVLTSSKLLFLVCLRDPAVQKMSTINDIVNYFCKQETTAANLGQLCAAHLYKTGGKDVTILLDGFDELPEDLQLQDGSFITELLEHRVLPSCNIIVSSRPHASVHLHNDVLLRVDILGFTEEDREHFITESLQSQPKKAKMLLEYLKSHPTISSLCFVPFIMTILLFLYEQGINLSDSPTDIYKHFVCFTVRRHLAKSGIYLQENITDLKYLPDPYKDIIKSLSKLSSS